jgi:ATP-dependent helicase Lhr and Lhr-like helicase
MCFGIFGRHRHLLKGASLASMSRLAASGLECFSSPTRRWFEASFVEPTAVQAKAWPAIARGEHVLLSAPTGSGKTLAAFLWALDRLASDKASSASSAPSQGAPSSDRSAVPSGRSAGGAGTRVVYVSPLKALSYDIERNLRAPLRGIGVQLSVGIRTGDTPARERAAMARRPPDILITTPESLYLILGSRARSMLDRVECVIVDEIHAVASVKRGAHLALTLERLEQLAGREVQRIGLSATQRPLEEVGRFLVGHRREVTIVDAAAASPLDLRIQVPVESMTELEYVGNEPSSNEPVGNEPVGNEPMSGERLGGEPVTDPLDPSEPAHGSIWPAIYPELLALVREHSSTIVFVNNRRSAERVALRLNELAETDIARAHHGSLSREERTLVEEQLKAGSLPCLVATSSLELGIDMGAVELVVQIESPKSVARGLQRIGRAGHDVGEVSKGRLFPKFRADLLECAVVCRRMREGAIEPTVVPRNPLDVLAQQIVAIAAADDLPPGPREVSLRGPCEVPLRGPREVSLQGPLEAVEGEGAAPEAGRGVGVEELYALVTRSYSYSELPRSLFEGVLDMLDGRYPSHEFGELRARIAWDRAGGRIAARRGARQLAVANAGTIPDRGLYTVTLADGRRVGELDEEMVYEARAGQVFLLGASSWRIEEIGRDRVIVTPAPGVPGAVPFWKGEGVGRPKELGAAIGAFARWAVDQDEQALMRDYDLDERAARNLIAYLREQRAATQVLPSDRTIVLERFRDEIGDWRLCLLSPYGGRVHAAWSLAITARIRESFGIDAEAIFSDDGVIVRLPDTDLDTLPPIDGDASSTREQGQSDTGSSRAGWGSPGSDQVDVRALGGAISDAELVAIDPEDVQDLITSELGSSALFGARFRESAARALLIPRAYPGRRTPLWQQRLKAHALLEVARRHSDFPIVLETYRECLRDVLDVPGLVELLGALQTRECSLVEVHTQTASPFASSLLFDYVAAYMYEGDTPSAERRATALSLDRDLLRELLGMEDLRELIDPGALDLLEQELSHRAAHTRATDADSLLDVLRDVGDLRGEELQERVSADADAFALLEQLESARRAARVRICGEERLIAAELAGLYRDALGCVPPPGLPAAFTAEVPDALLALLARYARCHGPFTSSALSDRYGVDAVAALRELESADVLVRGELRPGSSGREWCDAGVLRRLRRASIAALRKEIEPVDARTLASFLPSWQGVDAPTRTPGVERLRELLVSLQALPLPLAAWERDILPRRLGSYSPSWLDALCAGGEIVWVGAGPLGRHSGRVAIYFREDAALLGPPPLVRSSRPEQAEHELLRQRLGAGPCFFTDLMVDVDLPTATLASALWDLVWAGEVTNDSWAVLRASRHLLTRVRAPTMPSRPGIRARAERPAAAVAPPIGRSRAELGLRSARSALRGGRATTSGPLQGRWSLTAPLFLSEGDPARSRRARGELLLQRYGLLTREQVLAEGIPGGFSTLYGALSELETLGACRRGYFIEGLGGAQFALAGAVERLRGVSSPPALVLAAVDPAQPYGASLPWPARERPGRGPARTDGAYVVLVDSEPALFLERGGRSLLTLEPPGRQLGGDEQRGARLAIALRALAQAVSARTVARVALERIDGQAAIESDLCPLLVDAGFQLGPRRLTLRAGP